MPDPTPGPRVAVIGGSGFYTFLEDPETQPIETPYGAVPVSVGEVSGREVAFLPRHGAHHEYPPHGVNYRGNLWALRSIGVRQVIGPCAVGSLRPELAPGTLVVPDQLVDRTSGRVQTYVETGASHAPFADPYCPRISEHLVAAGDDIVGGGTMVVIEGPRFSTRAESQAYAGQGWSLVNMTGHPEAVLARELGLCYSALALVTDLDAGLEVGGGVSQAEVFALFAKNVERLKTLLAERGRLDAGPRRLHVCVLDGRRRPGLRAAMKVLLTGAAGFIGTAIARRLEERGHTWVGLDALIPEAHAADAELPEGVVRGDVRAPARWEHLLDDVDAVCHQAAMVGAGVTVADLPLYADHNDHGTAQLLSAMSRHGVDRLVLASSMVVYGEGRYACETHGVRVAGSRSVADLDAGRFDLTCDVCGEPLGWELVPEDAPLDPRSSYAASKLAQEHFAKAWVRQAPASAIALRYHNVYGPGMPRDTPYSGVAAIFRSALEKGEQPRVYEDGGQMRDFVHVDDIALANVRALEHVVESPDETWATYNVSSGRPITIADVARILGEGQEPLVTGQYRLGDVRHVVASPALATAELGFTAEVDPQQGLAEFRTAPLRA